MLARAQLELVAKYRARAAARQTNGDGLVVCPDPVLFAREWLGIDPWPRQEEFLRAVAEHDSVVVRSGHKTGKTTALAIVALWWVKSQRDARVVFTAPTSRQVEEVLWREVVALYNRAEQRGQPIGGHMYRRPDGGLRFPDGREIFGFSTDKSDKFSGISGNVLFLADEGSGVPDSIFEAIEGNRAGGGDIFGGAGPGAKKAGGNKVVVAGNPTRSVGTFYRAFRDPKEREQWHRIHISSVEAADYQAKVGKKVGYIATLEWVNQKRAQWGETSPLWYVRVRGEFAPRSESALIGLSLVEQARERWDVVCAILQRFASVPLAAADGDLDLFRAFEEARLQLLGNWALLPPEEQKLCEALQRPLSIGVDVAQFGPDSSAVAPRRGLFAYPMLVVRSMDGPDLAAKALEVSRALRNIPTGYAERHQLQEVEPERRGLHRGKGPERPRVKFDRIGNGASAYDAALHNHGGEIEAIPVNVAERATDETSERLRDQVWCAVRDWLTEGGMLPPDDFLQGELLAPDYGISSRGKIKVDDKDKIKAKLPEGRSPDRADALCLSVYDPPSEAIGRSLVNVMDR